MPKKKDTGSQSRKYRARHALKESKWAPGCVLVTSQLNLSGFSLRLQMGKLKPRRVTNGIKLTQEVGGFPCFQAGKCWERGLGVGGPRKRTPTPHPTWTTTYRELASTSTPHPPRQEAALCHPPA